MLWGSRLLVKPVAGGLLPFKKWDPDGLKAVWARYTNNRDDLLCFHCVWRLSCGKLQNNLKRDLRARMLFLLTTQDYRSWSFSTGRNTLVVIMGFQKPTDTWYYFKLDTQSWRERTKALHQNLELKFPWETCLPRSSARAVWGTSSCAAGPTITHCPVRVPSGGLVRRQYPATRVMAPNIDYQILNRRITRAQ